MDILISYEENYMLQDLATKNVIKRNKKVLKSKFKMEQQYLYTSSERKVVGCRH